MLQWCYNDVTNDVTIMLQMMLQWCYNGVTYDVTMMLQMMLQCCINDVTTICINDGAAEQSLSLISSLSVMFHG